MRKPRRNDTRAGANWALEVTPSRGMLFHPRSVPRSPSRLVRPAARRRLLACPLALSPSRRCPSTHSNLLLLFLLLLFSIHHESTRHGRRRFLRIRKPSRDEEKHKRMAIRSLSESLFLFPPILRCPARYERMTSFSFIYQAFDMTTL